MHMYDFLQCVSLYVSEDCVDKSSTHEWFFSTVYPYMNMKVL